MTSHLIQYLDFEIGIFFVILVSSFGFFNSMELNWVGKLLILLGLIFVAAGLILLFSGKLPYFGKLPGDIVIKKSGFTLYFPIVSFLILSLILTLILNIVFRLWRR